MALDNEARPDDQVIDLQGRMVLPAFRDTHVHPRGGMQLLEAYIRHHFNDEWSVRFGQFKLPFTREFLVSSARQLAVERSIVSDNLSMGWSQGIEGRYWNGPWRASLACRSSSGRWIDSTCA